MAVYSVLAVTPTTDAWVADYLPTANRLAEKHGARYLARTASHDQVAGAEEQAGLRIVLQWPTREAALAFINDPEYRPHLEARLAGSRSLHFLIDGKDDLA